jgi:hypothetical protein
MMTTSRISLAAGLGALALAAGCGTSGSPGAAPGAVTPTRAPKACVYPDSMTTLDTMRSGTDAVAVVRVASLVGTPDAVQPLVYWKATVERVLDARAKVPHQITIVEPTRTTDAFFKDRRYVMFLFARRQDPVRGTMFTVLNGWDGMLPVRDGAVTRECYGNGPGGRAPGTGHLSGESVEAFAGRYAEHAKAKPMASLPRGPVLPTAKP